MRHDDGCACPDCATTSTTDNVLIALLVIAGVVMAISTASKLVVGLAVVLLTGLAAAKLRAVKVLRKRR